MQLIKTTLAIAAAGCLGLVTTHAAGRGDSSGAGEKHFTHRASNDDDTRAGKASTNRTARVSSSRSHTTHRSSVGTGPSHNRKRSATNRDTSRAVNDIQPSVVNVQVQLPRRESENDTDTEAEDDDQSSILLGRATENDDGGRP